MIITCFPSLDTSWGRDETESRSAIYFPSTLRRTPKYFISIQAPTDKYVIHIILMISISTMVTRDGRGSYFFHGAGRGGEGLGQKSMGQAGAGTPPFPTVRGGAGKGSKSAGLGGARACTD